PKQVVRDALPAFFTYDTLPAAPDGQPGRLMEAEARTRFDLENGPLLRVCLRKTGEKRFVFVFTIHHLVADGWSMGQIVREVTAHYQAGRGAAQPALPALAVQFRDFAAWHVDQARSAGTQPDRGFWLAEFAGEASLLPLPATGSRATPAGKVLRFALSAADTAALRGLGGQEGTSLFMTLFAAFNALFYKYTGQTDIVLGTTTAGRVHETLENQVGYFVNTLAVRSRFSGRDPFTGLLRQVREKLLGGFRHQAYPLFKLLEDLAAVRATAPGPCSTC
ncbi:MAG: hypothetical protein ICV83_13260, partial [Cytophagales bacterium]|nr:hypothetical protein [Cytophagales bacterium]